MYNLWILKISHEKLIKTNFHTQKGHEQQHQWNFNIVFAFLRACSKQHQSAAFTISRAGVYESMDVYRLVAINFHLLLWEAHAFGVVPCAFFCPPYVLLTHPNHPKNGENFKICGEIERKSPPKLVFERIFRPFSRSWFNFSLTKCHVLRRILFKDFTCALEKSSRLKFHPGALKIGRVCDEKREWKVVSGWREDEKSRDYREKIAESFEKYQRKSVPKLIENKNFFVITWKSTCFDYQCAAVVQFCSIFLSIFSIFRNFAEENFQNFQSPSRFSPLKSSCRIFTSYFLAFLSTFKNSFS